DGLLWFDGVWVAVPDTQLPVVELLVRNLDRIVPDDELRRAYRAAGGSPRVASFRTQLHRIGRRVATVGLRLRIVRRQGAVLTAPGATPPSLRDDREMWLRDGCDPATVADAIDQLGRNANLAADRPLLGEDRILRHAGRWVPIPPSQIAVVELLVRHYRRLVTPEQIRSAYTRAGRPVSSASVGA